MSIIYCYTNKITGKKYIGQTLHPEQRKRSHLHEATKRDSQYYFHRSIRKHGWEAFDYEVLEETGDLGARENYWINHYNTIWPNGYNELQGEVMSDITRKKLSDTKKRIAAEKTPEERRAMVEAMVEANTGKKHSEETRRKRSESIKAYLKANPRVRSEETKRKTSESVKRARAEKFWSTKKGG